MRFPFVLALLPLLAACSTDTTIGAATYDQTCTTAADCTLVFVGDVCGCSCTEDSINKKDFAIFEADTVSKHDACDNSLNCAACEDTSIPACVSGKCGKTAAPTP
jgi:hypothetical protein